MPVVCTTELLSVHQQAVERGAFFEGGRAMKFETERLILREWQDTPDDLAALKEFLQDPQVMTAYEHAFSEEEVRHWLSWNLDSYQQNGFGLWALVRKADQRIIGECGLTLQQVKGQTYVEIGYHLIQDAWHQGYALESAQGCKRYAFDTLKVAEVVSTVRDTNLASLNVAIRNGMVARDRYIKEYYGQTMPHYLMMIRRDEDAALSLGHN